MAFQQSLRRMSTRSGPSALLIDTNTLATNLFPKTSKTIVVNAGLNTDSFSPRVAHESSRIPTSVLFHIDEIRDKEHEFPLMLPNQDDFC